MKLRRGWKMTRLAFTTAIY